MQSVRWRFHANCLTTSLAYGLPIPATMMGMWTGAWLMGGEVDLNAGGAAMLAIGIYALEVAIFAILLPIAMVLASKRCRRLYGCANGSKVLSRFYQLLVRAGMKVVMRVIERTDF